MRLRSFVVEAHVRLARRTPHTNDPLPFSGQGVALFNRVLQFDESTWV